MRKREQMLIRYVLSLVVLIAIAMIFHTVALAGVPGTQRWAFTTGGWVGSSPAIGPDGSIYVGAYDYNLYAINPDGTLKWAFDTGDWYVYSSPAIATDGTVYIGSYDHKLYAINPDGTQKWAFTTGSTIGSSPAIGTDGTIYVGSSDNKLYAINPNGTQKWAFPTGYAIWYSSPAIGADGTIYVGSCDNKLYAINPNGTPKWSFTTGGIIYDSPAIGADGTIYVGSDDCKLYAINPNGTQKWAFSAGYSPSAAIGADGTIYAGSSDGMLYALNPTGTQKWAFSAGASVARAPAIGNDGTIYAGTIDGKLFAVNPNGTQRWVFATGEDAGGLAIGPDGIVYVGDLCKLYALYSNSLGPANSSWPMFHHDVRHTGRTGYIIPPAVPYLCFDPISTPQTVGTAFPVTITARKVDGSVDTSFNGEVILSSSVPVGPAWVNLTNGVWSGQINVLGEGAGLILWAAGGGLTGTSNPFTATAGAALPTGNLDVKVQDAYENPVPQAKVYLSSEKASPILLQGEADASGYCKFTGIQARSYWLWAESPEGVKSYPEWLFVNSRYTAARLVELPFLNSERTPVVLVAGIMGSADKDQRYTPIPRLKHSDYNLDELQLHDPLRGSEFLGFDLNFSPGWRDLKDELHSRGVPTVDCPWDWRLSVESAVKKFLEPAIAKAQGGDPKRKVNIIAHSMGGLLVRHYIQTFPADQLQDLPIANFSMVGTPNQGSTNVYYIWEGGDTVGLDLAKQSAIPTYSLIMLNLLYDMGKSTTYLPALVSDLYKTGKIWDVNLIDNIMLRDFFQRHVRSVKELLPTYNFLVSDGNPKKIDTPGNVNEFLDNLNKDSGRFRMAPPSDPDLYKVKTRLYWSFSEPTLYLLQVKNSWVSQYADSTPRNRQDLLCVGDGTVPSVSAGLPIVENWAQGIPLEGEHFALFRENGNARIITEDLYPVPTALKAAGIQRDATPVQSQISLSFDGPIQPILTDPQGRKLGVNFDTGVIERSIPAGEIAIGSYQGSLSLGNPLDGSYTLMLNGVSTGAYRLSLTYVDKNGMVFRDCSGAVGANVVTLTVTVNSATSDKIQISSKVPAPSGLQANAVNTGGLKTTLSWTQSSDPKVVSYNIYARKMDGSGFVLIGNSTGASHSTSEPWAVDGTITPTLYVIAAVFEDGTESLFSNAVLNNDRDHDGISDADELKYSTNPDKADTDGDGYSDGAEINGGSNPLDPKSRPISLGKNIAPVIQLLLMD